MKLSERMLENMNGWIRIYPPVREWAKEVAQLEERINFLEPIVEGHEQSEKQYAEFLISQIEKNDD